MQFSIVAVLAAATAVQAGSYGYPAPGNVTYTTEVVTAYTTYCPEPTTLTHGDKTYTITEATTLTITDCPCTISKPVLTTSAHPVPTAYPPPPAPPAANTSIPVVPAPAPSAPAEAGAAKFAAAGLAAVLGAAAFVL
ncbi:hypothetical protein F5X68DRAFT_226972 [Plectosphaerella plurivora]|uniref:Clock-controlled protein 6 n=1 Tax=Plectosphaerella plurivora TaxID=936078 RepID=A0A9P8VQ10_9PEZI|nr:hypothetical protein F5X68DRAFT_226972 [Plectosphaerella plurivora]